tara:strand:- start:1798 stop:2190 length:393 start_codon:yes stop_codon:yes gene_type:complete
MKKYTQGYILNPYSMKVTQNDVIMYSEASGDKNPIHINQNFASKSMFKQTIAHGMMIGAFLSEFLFNEFGEAWLEEGSIDIKFKLPIFMNENITATSIVSNIENNMIKLNIAVIKKDGTEAVKGYATVKI